MPRTVEKIILGVVIIAIFGIGGIVIAGLDTTGETQASSEKNTMVSLDQAKAIALGVVDGVVTEAILEKENGVLVYEVDIKKDNQETEILIDPVTGNVIKTELEEESVSEVELKNVDKISEEQAIQIARSQVNLASVGEMTEVELEKENGVLVYAIEFTKNGIETDVKIDATTGEVVTIESDLDEEDQD